MTEWMVPAALAVGLALVVLQCGVLLMVQSLRRRIGEGLQTEAQRVAQLEALRQELLARLQTSSERVERELRREVQESARNGRQELAQNLATFQHSLVQQASEATRTQNTQIDAFGQQLALLQKNLSDTLASQLSALSESNARRMAEVRQTLEAQLAQLQTSNAAKLDEMRHGGRKVANHIASAVG